MANNVQPIKKRVNDVCVVLVKVLLDQIQRKVIDYDKMREISLYIYTKTKLINSEEEVTKLLEDLSMKWDFFKQVLNVEKLKVVETTGQDVKLNQLREKLLQFADKIN